LHGLPAARAAERIINIKLQDIIEENDERWTRAAATAATANTLANIADKLKWHKK
jgi:predicted protein tyrosine phosphatase